MRKLGSALVICRTESQVHVAYEGKGAFETEQHTDLTRPDDTSSVMGDLWHSRNWVYYLLLLPLR